MAQIVLEEVTKTFADGTQAVRDLTLTVPDGKLMVLVGPSGCGKTTALRMIAGLEQITSGRISIGGRVINELTPKERDVAMVFQNYALYPHMTVYQNIALSLRIRRVPRQQMEQRVREAARILEIEELLKRRPRELSGGQRQRVAMGRAIVRHPQAFLMDEPLSNLDAKLRVQMRAEISRIQRDLGVTTLYVTHDQTEAMTLGHRVAVMRDGLLQQVGTPQDLYRTPRNAFVGAFIGSPAMNMLEATLTSDNGDLTAQVGSHSLRLPPEVLSHRPALSAYVGRALALGIRPEDMEDASLAHGADAASVLRVSIDHHEDMGSELILYFEVDAPPLVTEDTRHVAADRGADAVRSLEQQAEKRRTTVVARVSARSQARTGGTAALHADMRNAHFFDLETGDAIYGGDRVPVGAPVSAAEGT